MDDWQLFKVIKDSGEKVSQAIKVLAGRQKMPEDEELLKIRFLLLLFYLLDNLINAISAIRIEIVHIEGQIRLPDRNLPKPSG